MTRDHDGKYGQAFDASLKAAGSQVVPIAVRAPNQLALIERFVQSIETECLDHFIPFDEAHLNLIVNQYVESYHEKRPHQGVGNVPLTEQPEAPKDIPTLKFVKCNMRLGGLLKHFHRQAA